MIAAGMNLAATVDVRSACGESPGLVCRLVAERTGNDAAAKVLDWLVGRPVKIGFILLVAWLATVFAHRLVSQFTSRLGVAAGGRLAARRSPDSAVGSLSAEIDLRAEQRFQTVGSVLRNAATVVIWAMAVLIMAQELGVVLGPLLAGAGIAGIAIGFGAQNLVRDVVSGLFILVEDQFGVGDTIEAAGHSGVVERLSLRSTRLRDVEGCVWHVPNSEARVIGNMSKGWSRALVDVPLPHGTDVGRATSAIVAGGGELRSHPRVGSDVLSEVAVWGIESITTDGLVLRVCVDTRAGRQAPVRRELRRLVNDALRREGIRTEASDPASDPDAEDPEDEPADGSESASKRRTTAESRS
jgi:small conductance mechanosensitive channel